MCLHAHILVSIKLKINNDLILHLINDMYVSVENICLCKDNFDHECESIYANN